jgi:two-component system cell cycle response regulator
VLFLVTLGTNHVDGLRDVQAIRELAERHLEPIELSWMDLMAGHFRGYLVGWAEEQKRAYQALNRLFDCPDAPVGLIANTKKNIGYSHLLVQNVDLARVYLEEAWRLYEPLPLTPRKLSSIKAWSQCLLAMGDPRRADLVMQPALAARGEVVTPLYLASALLVAAEIKLAIGDRALAVELVAEAAAAADGHAEPAILVHVAYVRALLLAEMGDAASAAEAAEQGCALITDNTHEIAVQSCVALTARLQARAGHFERAYELQGRLIDLRGELAAKAAEIRNIDLHVDHQTHLARMEIEHARRERTIAEAAEAAIVQKNLLLEQRLREVERLQESLRDLANRDALTGLFNRRYLGEQLPGLLSMVARQKERITVVLIDLDHFKAVNDRYGHQMGDLVLQGFADLLRDGFRAHDLCCRYGGEEFCVLMSDTADVAARARVEELLVRFGERVFRVGDKQLTQAGFSAGIVSFAADVRIDMDLVFRRADQALYAAKNAGRRQIAAVQWVARARDGWAGMGV